MSPTCIFLNSDTSVTSYGQIIFNSFGLIPVEPELRHATEKVCLMHAQDALLHRALGSESGPGHESVSGSNPDYYQWTGRPICHFPAVWH